MEATSETDHDAELHVRLYVTVARYRSLVQNLRQIIPPPLQLLCPPMNATPRGSCIELTEARNVQPKLADYVPRRSRHR